MKNFFKNFALAVFLLVFAVGLFSMFAQTPEKTESISLSQLVTDINDAKIKSVTVTDGTLNIVYNDDKKAVAEKEIDSSLSQTLVNLGAKTDALSKVSFESKADTSVWSWLAPLLLSSILPLAIFVIIMMMIFRQAKGNAMQAFDFTKAKTRMLTGENQKGKVTFNDVAGLEEAKEELQEIIDF